MHRLVVPRGRHDMALVRKLGHSIDSVKTTIVAPEDTPSLPESMRTVNKASPKPNASEGLDDSRARRNEPVLQEGTVGDRSTDHALPTV